MVYKFEELGVGMVLRPSDSEGVHNSVRSTIPTPNSSNLYTFASWVAEGFMWGVEGEGDLFFYRLI